MSELKNERMIESKEQTIYRYKFTTEFMEELYTFSKIHQYDERHDFKEAWNTWVEDNNELIVEEGRRLENLGYDGDILDKMFRSARYYLRKKDTVKPEPKERRQYVSVPKEFLQSIDEHIKSNQFNKDYQPKVAYNDFCKENQDLLERCINEIMEKGLVDEEDVKNKLKKTYKNRYFRIMSA